ncbi:MAG: glycogen synthase [Bacteroidetes bacterium]|nr:MAG: glycogen synthase [Bacteroidota bacterium]
MEKPKVLFVQQEITPYLKETHKSLIGRQLPQGIQDRGKEIRTFMPRFGNINERRNQLHEVIRLSGMNLVINDTDHPLIIKVASIQSARMQIYFIDNDDFFKRKFTVLDKTGKMFVDNDERAIFFTRGVIETVKKLSWAPNIVHCNGWFTALMPVYVKVALKDSGMFSDTKVIYSIYDDGFEGNLSDKISQKFKTQGVGEEFTPKLTDPSFINLSKTAIDYSDGIIFGSEKINPELEAYVRESGKPVLAYQNPENYMDAYNEFYDEIIVHESVLTQ